MAHALLPRRGPFHASIRVRSRRLVLVGVVVFHVVVVAATPLRFFEFLAALAGLFAVLAVALHRIAQLIFRLVNTPFTFVVRPRRERRTPKAGDSQQCNAKNSHHSGHVFSVLIVFLSWSNLSVGRGGRYSPETSPEWWVWARAERTGCAGGLDIGAGSRRDSEMRRSRTAGGTPTLHGKTPGIWNPIPGVLSYADPLLDGRYGAGLNLRLAPARTTAPPNSGMVHEAIELVIVNGTV
jgi:hypothetical protein